MVEYNALVVTGLVGFGIGTLVTLILVLLVVIYNNIKAVSDKVKEDEEDPSMILPLSALMGGGGGGPPLTMNEMMKIKAAMAQHMGGGAPSEDKDKKPEVGGNYL